jgi:hypothetical protein
VSTYNTNAQDYDEKQVQGWSRLKKQALIAGNYDKLVEFSKNYSEHGKPFLEGCLISVKDPVERNSDASLDPSAASTGSASAYMSDDERLTSPTN